MQAKMSKEESVLAIFLNNERQVEKLYRLYSSKFPGLSKVWNKLIPEEQEHVSMLKNLKEKVGESNDCFEINDYSMQTLEYVSNFVNSEIKKIEAGKVTLLGALEAALSLEQSMIEEKCFEMFKPAHPEIDKVFKKLNKDTASHRKILEKAYKKALNNS